MKEREKKTITTIRGIAVDLYNDLTLIAKTLGKTVGETVNEALSLYLDDLERQARERGAVEVSDIEELSVSMRDFEGLDKPVSFQNIGHLTFEDDVTAETFEKYVCYVKNCKLLEVPNIPKLLVYSRLRDVKEVVIGRG